MKVITVARKPVQGTIANNALVYGTGGLDIETSRIPTAGRKLTVAEYKGAGDHFLGAGFDGGSKAAGYTDFGRWPANLILTQSSAAALDEQSGILKSGAMDSVAQGGEYSAYGRMYPRRVVNPPSEGGASRFFKVVTE